MSYVITPRHTFLQATNYDANLGEYRVKSLLGTNQQRFTFQIPSDFSSIQSFIVLGNVSPGAALTNRDIDFYFEYHTENQIYNQGSTSDTTTVYDLSSYSNKTYGFDFTTLLQTKILARYILGMRIDHKTIGGPIRYFGIELIYYPKQGE
jgi:hypothetical protein